MRVLLFSQGEFFADLMFVMVGAVAGLLHANRLIGASPSVSLTNVHLHAKGALRIIFVILAGVVVLSIACIFRSVAWAIPLAVELLFPFLKWGGLSVVFAYLAGLSLRVAWHSQHRERGKLTFALVGLILAVLILRWQANRPIPPECYGDDVDEIGCVLQTTEASCGPATIVNILGRFGIKETERTLGVEMGTTRLGSTPGRAALALRRRGLCCRRVNVSSILEVRPPAALLVDFPSLGPESHMIGFMGMQGDDVEIWDPLQGRFMMDPDELLLIWHGKALEVYKP
jgi:hypothetical protein